MKKVIRIVAWMFLGVLAIGFAMVFFLNKDLGATTQEEISPIDLSVLADGDYEGIYENGRFTNRVVVTVKDHKIVDIDFYETVEFDWPEVREALIQEVLKKQNIDIDTISEATATSKAYLKSIEDALRP